MRLARDNGFGEPLYECDQCQIVGPKGSVIIEEQSRHLCMSCWFEKERNRVRKDKRRLVEI